MKQKKHWGNKTPETVNVWRILGGSLCVLAMICIVMMMYKLDIVYGLYNKDK